MDYIRHTNAIDTFYANLDRLIAGGTLTHRKIYMFGSSKVASMIVYYLHQNGVALEGIIDNNPSCVGNIVFDLPVYAPDRLSVANREEVLVMIASGYQDAMIQQLESMGLEYGRNIIKVIDLPALMEDYSFVDRTGYIPLTWQEVRESYMGILRCVHRICQKKDYRYYMAYGTLLGAVRHRGFIPWDDDVDIYVDIRDLPDFIEAVNQETDYAIASLIGDMDYCDMISLMYDRNMVCDSNHFPMQISAGVTIDVFPLYGLPDSKEELFAYSNRLKNAEMDMLNHLYSAEECKAARRRLFSMMQQYDMDTVSRVGNIISPYQLRENFPKEWFTESIELEFEGERFRAPAGWDGYLRAVYDDYMTFPPEESRKGHHFYHVYHRPQ